MSPFSRLNLNPPEIATALLTYAMLVFSAILALATLFTGDGNPIVAFVCLAVCIALIRYAVSLAISEPERAAS